MIPRGTIVVALAALAACAYNPPPVAIQASAQDLARLAGHWTGEYDSADTGRSGSIAFSLLAGEDHAHGDVLMIPRGVDHSYHSWPSSAPGQMPGERSEVLTIRFVAAGHGEVSGVLDPYRDPDCDCRALTRFQGQLRDDTIEGTFVTSTSEATRPSHGTWRVRRKRS
jgi:hypothetical protein